MSQNITCIGLESKVNSELISVNGQSLLFEREKMAEPWHDL